MKKLRVNLVPQCVNPTPDYYCTWQTQLYATCDGKPEGQRAIIGERALFSKERPYGWAYFYEQARKDLILVMDDSWDVPPDGDPEYYGSLVLDKEKFPQVTYSAKTNAEALKRLADKVKLLGWKGLGGWVCAQESAKYIENKTEEEYWKERMTEAESSGFLYWKVDWGQKENDPQFRKMLTELGKKYAPSLTVEHAKANESVSCSDVFRTYDVPAIMSIPMTMEKIKDLKGIRKVSDECLGLINCEDEVYIAAAGGFCMGIMRHPYSGEFMDGKADMSFPAVHRNIKTKIYEVVRAARWHRIAPAFGVNDDICVSNTYLSDWWCFNRKETEIEAWWFDMTIFRGRVEDNIIKMSAPAYITRACMSPEVKPDKDGRVPYIVASKNPNGVFSVATLGRTLGRVYEIPKCEVSVHIGESETVGIFGEYERLILKTSHIAVKAVLMQDIASEFAYDVTECVQLCNDSIVIPGELISKIGTEAQPDDDTSEPGVVLRLIV